MEKDWTKFLPSWAKWNATLSEVVCDPNVVYPLFLHKLAEIDPAQYSSAVVKPNQHQLEDARLTATRYLKKIMYEHGGTFMNLRWLKRPEWALNKFQDNEAVPTNRFALIYPALDLIEPIKPPAKFVHPDLA